MVDEAIPPASRGVGDLKRLYLEFGPQLERIVRGGTRAPDPVVEDACQVAWARLLRHQDRVAPPTAPGWLTKTALHEAVRLARRDRRELSLDLEARETADYPRRPTPDPHELLSQRQRLDLVRRLSQRQQRLVWLRALGFTYEEMASKERCSYRTVERQLERAGQRLRLLEADDGAARGA